eukprot:c21433_g2_i1 orf=330-1442(-)
MGGGALLKGLWREGQLQRSLAHHGFSYVSCRAMSSRLFVGGLSFTTEEEGLRTAFSKYGEVVDARIVTDRESGRSRGFGFVTFLAEADADTAKDKLNGQFLDGRVIRVDRAAARPAPVPRVSMPPQPEEQPTPQDWGSIPSPIAAVPQNAGLVQTSSELPSLSSLASSSSNNPPSNPLPPPSMPPPVEPPRPSFSFNLDLSTPDPNFVPRHRPPRIRPSMMDYEFGLFSDTSKFPYNTNFGTGFLKVRAPESEFDFSDIKEANAIKAAAKKVQEAEASAKEAAAKLAQEVGVAATDQSQEAAITSTEPAQMTSEANDTPQNTAQAGATQVQSSSQIASQEPIHATMSDPVCSSPAEASHVNASELRQVEL